MDKIDFANYIKEQIGNLPTEQQKGILLQMKEDWIPLVIKVLIKDKRYCDSCGKYSSVDEFAKSHKTEIHTEYTYRDAGYGDDDRMGEVERLVYYMQCPLCKQERVDHTVFIRIISERER